MRILPTCIYQKNNPTNLTLAFDDTDNNDLIKLTDTRNTDALPAVEGRHQYVTAKKK